MANLGVQNFDLRKNENILLLQEFEESNESDATIRLQQEKAF
jgi:hypothetical protein